MIQGIHHVQLAMPPGGEELAEGFYAGVLGLSPKPKPAALGGRGGCWFACHGAEIHLGVEQGFRPAKKAHPAMLVGDLEGVVTMLTRISYPFVRDVDLPDHSRIFLDDPFGNRLEIIAPIPGRAETG